MDHNTRRVVIGLPTADAPGRLHPGTLLVGPIRQLGGWIVPIVIALVIGAGTEGFGGFVFVAWALAATFVGQLIAVLRVRWWVDTDGLHVRKGLLSVEERTLPLDRIHNVDVTQPLFARLLGMAAITVESGGSSQTDVSLEFIPVALAEAVRSSLLGHVADGPVAEAVPLVHTSTRELLVAGATANRVGALAAGVAAAIGVLFEAGVEPEVIVDLAGELARPTVTLGALFVAAAIVIGWLVSIVQSVVRFHDFTLVLDDEEARRTHGLLTKASGRIPLPRVQTVRVEEAWLRRLFRRATILAETAGSVSAGGDTGTGIVAPIIGAARIPELASTVLRRPGTTIDALHPVSRIAVRRGFVRSWVPGAVVAGALAVVLDAWWAAAAVAWAPVAWAWATARWRAIGYRLEPDLLVTASGVFTRRTWLVPTAKVQSTSVRRTLLQRRWGLADLVIDTAAGAVRVIELEDDVARGLATDLAVRSALTAGLTDGV